MRHGCRKPQPDLYSASGHCASNGASALKLDELIPGELLGCYFCNDVVAPGDVSFLIAFSYFFNLQ